MIWEGGKKSIIKFSNNKEGVAAPGQNVMAKTKKKSQKQWSARVMEVGKAKLGMLQNIQIPFTGMIKNIY